MTRASGVFSQSRFVVVRYIPLSPPFYSLPRICNRLVSQTACACTVACSRRPSQSLSRSSRQLWTREDFEVGARQGRSSWQGHIEISAFGEVLVDRRNRATAAKSITSCCSAPTRYRLFQRNSPCDLLIRFEHSSFSI